MPGYRIFIAIPRHKGVMPWQFRALAQELERRGHHVLLLINPRAQKGPNDKPNPPNIAEWPSVRPVKWRDAVFLAKRIRMDRPQCLISNFAAENIMLLVGWVFRIPIRITWYHTLYSATEYDEKIALVKSRLLRLRKVLIYFLATYVVGVSEAARREASKIYHIAPRKCKVFHNSLPDPIGRISIVDPAQRTRTIVCAGVLTRNKGQDVLMRAVSLAIRSLPSLNVEFLGDGPLREEYENMSRDLGLTGVCHFRGIVIHDEVLRAMSSASVTVVPSRSEAFGLVIIESLAVGTPVIASAVGGIPEIVQDGVEGFLVPPGDDRSLAERIEEIFMNTTLRSSMSSRARERFVSQFEQSGRVHRQADFLEACLASRVQGARSSL
jgi:glycosyltransferase involved in cell wall biosynthesis